LAVAISDQQLAEAIHEIKRRLRPDEVALAGSAEEPSRARAERLRQKIARLQSELDSARQARDGLLEDNRRLATANQALQARATALEQARPVAEGTADRSPNGSHSRPSPDAEQNGSPASVSPQIDSPRVPAQLVAEDSPFPDRGMRLRALMDELGAEVTRDGTLVLEPLHVAFDPANDELTESSNAVLTKLAALARLYGAEAVHVSLFHSTSAGQDDGRASLQRRARALSEALASIYGAGAAVTAAVEPGGVGNPAEGIIGVEIRR
jgi:outer membrane protein OmpA-like peptidoglycan-associated protein